ncbi:MAG: hypothetical protein QM645_12980 [Asticcacaulis sp.]
MRFAKSFDLAQALKASVAFVPIAWSQAWLALIVLFGLVVAGQTAFVMSGGVWGQRGIILAVLVFQFVVTGALYRVALFGSQAKTEGLGLGGVQFAKPELRLMGAGILVSLFWLMVFVMLCVVLALFLSAAGLAERVGSLEGLLREFVSGPQPQGAILLITVVAIMFVLITLSIKLWLHQAATIGERQVVSLNALRLSKGQALKLFTGYFVLTLPFVLIGAVVPAQWGAAAAWINLALGIGVFWPLTVGFFASAYQQIIALRADAEA